ncbi:transcriptional protein SWT1 [Musca domestica]|uniref:Transcriptional protein SWT1 n=1 Tax=Musca domestica TaxID=7370 RepID=A0A1I8MM14_MUSDO|nr:transcriptional protein SWT1 [Musca domestica]
MDEGKPKKPDDWIKVQSKSRPGRYYLFNRATGENKWLSNDSKSKEESGDSNEKHTSPTKKKSIVEESPPPRISVPKPLKTPAQDRLKRLQHEIKLQQTKKQEMKHKRRHTEENDSKLTKTQDCKEQQENRWHTVESKETSSTSKTKAAKLLDAIKVKQDLGDQQENRPLTKESTEASTSSKSKADKLLDGIKVKQEKSSETKISESPKKKDAKTTKDSNIAKNSKERAERTTPSKRKDKSEDSPKKTLDSPRKRAAKRPHLNLLETAEKGNKIKKSDLSQFVTPLPAKLSHTIDSHKKESPPPSTNLYYLLDEDTEMLPCDEAPSTSLNNNLPNKTNSKSSKIGNIRSGIVNKIKDICKLPFRSSKAESIETKSSVLSAKTSFKSHKKTENKLELGTFPVQQTLSEFREAQKTLSQEHSHDTSATSTTSSLLTFATPPSTPKNFNIPAYSKGSANSRLERLRQSLLSQQQSMHSNTSVPYPKDSGFSTGPAVTSPSVKSEANSTLNETSNSVFHTANNTLNDEFEEMDWEPFEKDNTETIEISSSESNLSLLPPKEKPIVKSPSTKSMPETMGDIYDAVNENLLRLSAEKKTNVRANNNKWRKDYYYFVVDTNVLLDHLTFIEDLTQLKLCDTQGSMLYIPYGVLQELDKLKMREEGVKTLAVRAIKYLNKKLENKSQNVLAQTALEEREHLIDVNSADDSIINCCLQAKAQIPNLLLLTEDVNLRNKAICNNILVATKSDLLSKRYDAQAS